MYLIKTFLVQIYICFDVIKISFIVLKYFLYIGLSLTFSFKVGFKLGQTYCSDLLLWYFFSFCNQWVSMFITSDVGTFYELFVGCWYSVPVWFYICFLLSQGRNGKCPWILFWEFREILIALADRQHSPWSFPIQVQIGTTVVIIKRQA